MSHRNSVPAPEVPLIPVPMRMSRVINFSHNACSELLVQFVDPHDLPLVPTALNAYQFCGDIKNEFHDYMRGPRRSHDQIEHKALELLSRARATFDSLCAIPYSLFSVWAYQNAQSEDADMSGATVFHTLLSWCHPFEGPEARANMEKLIEISEILGCRYTAVMLAFGLYPGYRTPDEILCIFRCLCSFLTLRPGVSFRFMQQQHFLDRAVYLAATWRTVRNACGGMSATEMFPSPIEVGLSVQCCVEQALTEFGDAVAPQTRVAPLAPPPASPQQFQQFHGHYQELGGLREDQQQQLDSRAVIQRPPPCEAPLRLQGSAASSSTATGRTVSTYSITNSGAATTTTGSGTAWAMASASAQSRSGPASASALLGTRRPTVSSSSSSSSSSSFPPAKRPAAYMGGDESDEDGPPAPKRRNAGKEPAVVRRPPLDTVVAGPSSAPQPAAASHPPLSPNVHCDDATDLIMQENILHEQFLDFVTKYHEYVSAGGMRFLNYLARQHHDLIQSKGELERQQKHQQQQQQHSPRLPASGVLYNHTQDAVPELLPGEYRHHHHQNHHHHHQQQRYEPVPAHAAFQPDADADTIAAPSTPPPAPPHGITGLPLPGFPPNLLQQQQLLLQQQQAQLQHIQHQQHAQLMSRIQQLVAGQDRNQAQNESQRRDDLDIFPRAPAQPPLPALPPLRYYDHDHHHHHHQNHHGHDSHAPQAFMLSSPQVAQVPVSGSGSGSGPSSTPPVLAPQPRPLRARLDEDLGAAGLAHEGVREGGHPGVQIGAAARGDRLSVASVSHAADDGADVGWSMAGSGPPPLFYPGHAAPPSPVYYPRSVVSPTPSLDAVAEPPEEEVTQHDEINGEDDDNDKENDVVAA